MGLSRKPDDVVKRLRARLGAQDAATARLKRDVANSALPRPRRDQARRDLVASRAAAAAIRRSIKRWEAKAAQQDRQPAGELRTGARGLALIKASEGVRLTAYKPVPGEPYWTIGYGHYGPDVRAGQRITMAQADRFLVQDLRRFEQAVARHVRVPLNQHEFDALVSLAYNIGEGNLASSTVVRQLNAGRRRLAAAAFAMWTRGGVPLRVLPGLVKRRAAEARLFLSRP